MTYTVLAPAGVITLLGLLVYLLSEKPKVAEVGRIMFGTGLLACLLGAPGLFK